jgi:Plasma-membrane choline transporter
MEQQENQIPNDLDHSTSSSYEDTAPPFFADMTLDLAEAHDIAETPEPKQRTLIEAREIVDVHSLAQLPTISTISSGNNTVNSNNISINIVSRPTPGGADGMIRSDDNDITAAATTIDQSSSQQYQQGSHDHNPQDDYLPQVMGRVTSSDPGMSTARNYRSASNVLMRGAGGSRRRLRSKDVAWAVCFILIVPTSLLVPPLLLNRHYHTDSDSSSDIWLATARAPRLATFHTLLWGFVAALILARLLYRTSGGGDGDDARHFASQILLASAPISVSVYIFLLLAIYWFAPHGTWMFSLIPLWYLGRDVYLFRRWKMTSTTPGGRQSFFQALTCMSLDILSRSLRRLPFWRCVIASLFFQFFLIAWWRIALLAALRSGSVFWIIVTAGGGKWGTGTVARLMSLIASGGIANWFAEQSTLVQEMQQQQQQQQNQQQDETPTNSREVENQQGESSVDVEVNDGHVSLEFANIPKDYSSDFDNHDGVLPEAYRTVDASAYRSVVQFDDEGIDDDMSEDDADVETAAFYLGGGTNITGNKRQSGIFTSSGHQRRSGSTVKQLLTAGLSVSFGSVAKCGLLGGIAQFIWSQIRKIDHARATFGGLRGMEIQGGNEIGHDRSQSQGRIRLAMKNFNGRARTFVQNNSDMAMSFVALYQMAYSPASREVALVLDERGVEPIIHDDISTHISSCVGGSVSGLVVVFTGAILAHQRNNSSPGVPDTAVVLDMLLAFFFCYTLIFTVMEPLRASIKAVYVSFAQHPESLKASFPLIYHRLTRMSQNNVS